MPSQNSMACIAKSKPESKDMKKINQLIGAMALVLSLASCEQPQSVQPRQTDIVDAVFASGQVISEQEYLVTANTEGYLQTSFVEAGVRVNAATPLFKISNGVQVQNLTNAEANYKDALARAQPSAPERVQLDLQVEQAQAQLALDQKNFNRHQRLLKSGAVSQLDFEKAELQYENALRNVRIQQQALDDLIGSRKLALQNAESKWKIQQENNADYFLSSAIDGQVLEVYKKAGELVRRGEAVAKIGGGTQLIKLFVAEEDINEIALNQEVIFNLNTSKEATYEAVVYKIYPSFNEQEQSFEVEALVKKGPKQLFHNSQLQANIVIGKRADAWVIPKQYLLQGDSVMLKNGDRQAVQTGLRTGQWVEIIEGLNPQTELIMPEAL